MFPTVNGYKVKVRVMGNDVIDDVITSVFPSFIIAYDVIITSYYVGR